MLFGRSHLAFRKNQRIALVQADTYARPTLLSAVPATGTVTGGTSVVLTGTVLTTTQSVYFGATAATSFTVDSATQITAVSPAGSAGAVSLVVNTLGGCAILAGAFAYVAVGDPRVTELGDDRITEAGDARVTES